MSENLTEIFRNVADTIITFNITIGQLKINLFQIFIGISITIVSIKVIGLLRFIFFSKGRGKKLKR